MCIKAEYTDYLRKDMSLEDFKKIAPYFAKVKSVVLEGWGESLLHPNLLDFIRITKEYGSDVGFVTSGYGLNADYIAELLRAGLDFIGFSFSGAKAKTHEMIRINSDFENLLSSINHFHELARKMGVGCPKMHIVYLILKENVEEVPMIVDLAKSLNIKEIVFLNIIQISNRTQDEMKVFTYEGENPYEKFLLEAKRKAFSYGVRIFSPSLVAREIAMCPETPLRSLYVSVEGDVSPCVYLNPPVKSPFVRFFKGEMVEVEKITFGNIFFETLEDIWIKDDYQMFRKAHLEREKIGRRILENLIDLKMLKECRLPPLLRPCMSCHKIYGL